MLFRKNPPVAGRRRPQRNFETLERRQMLAADIIDAAAILKSSVYQFSNPEAAIAAIQRVRTNASDETYSIPTPVDEGGPLPESDGRATANDFRTHLSASTARMNLDGLRADPRFAALDGSGLATVVLDTGIDLDHPHFGPDVDGDAIADRIVFQQSFTGSASADDDNGHGTHVQATVASSDPTFQGVAPSANLIALKTNGSNGSGRFSDLERALQWVVVNGPAYNVGSVNMSLGDGQFFTEATTRYGIGDELAALAAMDIVVVSSSGNDYQFNSQNGVGYPSADPNSFSIGSERVSGGLSSFSQRDPELTTVFAPGEPVTAAWPGGGVRRLQGTSMASPHVAGAVLLVQQLADEVLSRRLSFDEVETLIRQTGPGRGLIPETGAQYRGVDMLQLAEAIVGMDVASVDLVAGGLTITGGNAREASGTAMVQVTNNGTTAAPATQMDLLLSRNATISMTGDLRIASATVPAIAAGQTVSVSIPFTLPDANAVIWDLDDQYALGVHVDAGISLDETDEANNLNQAIGTDIVERTIDNLPIDLIGQSLAIDFNDGFWGGQVVVDYTIANLGDGPAGASSVAFYLSRDSVIDPAVDIAIGTDALASVPGGGSLSDSAFLVLPDPNDAIWVDGQNGYTIGMVVDSAGDVLESDEGNNQNRGDGLDATSIVLDAPASSIYGTVYHDADNDGVIRPRADHRFTITHTVPGPINPFSPPVVMIPGLPRYASDAQVRVRVRGQFGPPSTSLSIGFDSYIETFFSGVAPEGDNVILAERTRSLSGPAWEAAIADGEIRLVVDPNVGGSFTTNGSDFVEVTISYVVADENLAYGTFQAPGEVLANRNTPVTIASMGEAIGDGTIELWAIGLLGPADRTATLNIENELTVELLDNNESNTFLVVDAGSIDVDAATLNRWLADGELTATVNFANGVSQQREGNSFEVRLRYPIASDDGLSGKVVHLDIDGDGIVDQTTTTLADDPATPANEAGNFAFINVPAGSHTLSVAQTAGINVTSPSNNQQSTNVVTGQSPRGIHFGVFLIPDTAPPRIEDVWVHSDAWGDSLRNSFAADGRFSLRGPDQLVSIPWIGGIDEVVLQFSEDIGDSFRIDDFVLRGADELNLVRPESIRYEPETFRVIIRPVAAIEADRMMISVRDTVTDAFGNRLDGEWVDAQDAASGDGTAGGHFHFRFSVLVGDANGDGTVTSGDLALFVASSGQSLGSGTYNVRADWNGDGTVSSGDLLVFLSNSGESLPSSYPPPPSFNDGTGSGSGSGAGFDGRNHGGKGSNLKLFTDNRDAVFAGLIAR